MGINTKYGLCKGECGKWVPRDKMLSINVSVYNSFNEEHKIQLRFCESCHKEMVDYLSLMSWDNLLYTEAQIITDPDLVKNSDLEYDDSVDMIEAAAIAAEREEFQRRSTVFRDRVADDSEAAMRRRGKIADEWEGRY